MMSDAATLELFAETFAPCGFNRAALLPCYGMAEASLIVSGKTRGQPPVIAGFDPVRLSEPRRHGNRYSLRHADHQGGNRSPRQDAGHDQGYCPG